MDYPVHGTIRARILQWVTYPFSSRSSWPKIEPESPALQVDFSPTELSGKPRENHHYKYTYSFFFFTLSPILGYCKILTIVPHVVGPCWFLNSVNWKSLICAHSCRGQVAVGTIYWLEHLPLWVTLNCSPSPANFSHPLIVWWKS